MHFAGYSLAQVLGVFAGAAALATFLYVLKLRRRPVPVVYSPIWKQVLGDREASRLFSHLKRLLSLLVQLLLLGLLALSLGDPRQSDGAEQARHTVVLVDASASMQARDVLPSRLSRSRELLRERVRHLGRLDQMLIAQLDASVTPLSPMTGDIRELERALEAIVATDAAADLGRGLAFAEDALRERNGPALLLVSDGAFSDESLSRLSLRSGLPVELLSVGERDDNLAITGLSVRRYPLDRSRYEVMLQLENTGTQPADFELDLLGDGQLVETTALHLEPGEKSSRFYPNLGGASESLEALLRAPLTLDYLARDNRAFALMPERRGVRVLVVSRGNSYLDAALLLDEYLDVIQAEPEQPLPAGQFDVTILDGVSVPFEPRLGGTFYLNVPETGAPVARRRAITGFGFDHWKEEPPLLRWMAPDNVQVARGHVLSSEPGDVVVGASELGPILVSGRRGEQRFVALGFDPRDSDLVLRVAWPLLVLNVINHFVEESVHYVSSYRTGEVWQIAGLGDLGAAWIRHSEAPGERLLVRAGSATHLGLHAGFHSLGAEGSTTVLRRLAANLADSEESRIRPRQALPVLETRVAEASSPGGGVRQEPWAYLLVLVLVLSSVEWLTYHRRLTV